MSGFEPNQQPKPESKGSGGPPKPPKPPTGDLLDGSGEPESDDNYISPETKMYSVGSHTMQILQTLTDLHGGGRPRIRESLETDLDQNAVLLSGLTSQLQGENLARVMESLRLIRDYRRRHPRSDASNRQQAEQAQKILDEIR
jgi:hypothetical protein